jgi:5-oxoprolinase (ATP-hydrolysing)
MYSGGAWHAAALVVRDDLRCGDVLQGPASSPSRMRRPSSSPAGRPHSPRATTWCWSGVTPRAAAARGRHAGRSGAAGGVQQPVHEHRRADGLQLQNTAYSVNIKERLDFSCALFDAQGQLIANAPHMPVHLGSMGESIQTVIRDNAGRMQRGDVFVLNDPYHGGTHLPDITVITPVYLQADGAGAAVLCRQPRPPRRRRRHHAGLDAAVLAPHRRGGRADPQFQAGGRGRAAGGRAAGPAGRGAHPARNPAQNMADLRAQIAANEKGVQELQKMVDQFGLDVVQAYMRHVQDNAEESVRRVITRLQDGALRAAAGQRRPHRRRGPRGCGRAQRRGRLHRHLAAAANNFNAPRAVCMAAVLYVFRTLVDDDIPLNAGCLKPLRVIDSGGCMLNPDPPAAVVAGNVETSTCITNALFGALGVMAASQCTMNNFTFGNDRYQYYETIAGGSGADRRGRRDQRGADPHDELPPDRPGGAGVPLPGAAGELHRCAADPAARAAGAAATAACAACASWSR